MENHTKASTVEERAAASSAPHGFCTLLVDDNSVVQAADESAGKSCGA
jgi:hypothetical protein